MSKSDFKDYKLSEEILRALDGLGYKLPTEVQSRVIPVALEQKDITVKSQTGSGKTAAFGIPICEMVDWDENKPQALILTPTRELAAQIKEDIINIGRFKRIKATAVYGKQPFAKQKLELKQKSHVVVGTPGRVLDHIQKQTLDLEKVKFLVLDEADEMLNMGFIEQVEAIIKELPRKRVTMLFSATLPKAVEDLCHKYMNDPIDIEINATERTTNKINHSIYRVGEGDKFKLLKDITIIENPDSCIIFCATQEQVDNIFRQLDRLDYPCAKIHGGLIQEVRFEVMNDFKRGEFRYLVATDVAARGIDIDDVTLVINYDFPMEKESYVHRTGRTGRAGKVGKAISLATPSEEKYLKEVEEYIGFEIPKSEVPSNRDVLKQKPAFEKKIHSQPIVKEDRGAKLNKDIFKLYFNGGKKKKLRAVDFVGTISKLEGIKADDIGIITIEDNATYVEILNGKGPQVLDAMKHTTIKGKLLKVHQAR